MNYATLDAAVREVAVCRCVTHSLAVLALQDLLVVDLFEAHQGMLDRPDACDLLLRKRGVECDQPQI